MRTTTIAWFECSHCKSIFQPTLAPTICNKCAGTLLNALKDPLFAVTDRGESVIREFKQLSLCVVSVRLFFFSREDYFLSRGGSSPEARIDIVLEKSELLLPCVKAMGGLGKSMQLLWIGKVEGGFVMSAQSLHELG